jgi:hypothetical protein
MKHTLILVILCVTPGICSAQILGSESLTIDFTKPEDAKKKATWGDRAKLAITDKGLGWDGEQNALREGWIQTQALAVGLSWRAAQSVSVNVVIRPAPRVIKLPNGQQSTPGPGFVFVRHSPDRKHWSSWQFLKDVSDKKDRSFSGRVRIPSRDREEYGRLGEEYHKLDVPWKSDEEAFAVWVVKRQPDFFREHKPFIGYVQFLFEESFWGGRRITHFEASASFALNGMASIPRDKDADKDRDMPWRFRAP